jgi:hypothetical protein
MVGAIFLWGFCELLHIGLGASWAKRSGRQHIGWLGNEGAKMTNDSKNEEDKLTTNDSSREITADELDKVVGGMGPFLIFRQFRPLSISIPGESPDDRHKDDSITNYP